MSNKIDFSTIDSREFKKVVKLLSTKELKDMLAEREKTLLMEIKPPNQAYSDIVDHIFFIKEELKKRGVEVI